MVQEPRRAPLPGSPLIRLLARWTDAPVASTQGFADRLSHWLGWTDAIALSSALQAPPPPAAAARAAPAADAVSALRRRLSQPLDIDPADLADGTDSAGFAPLRRRYQARQQALETDVAALRARLREALSARSPQLARLAALDAAMEQALAAREQALLSAVPRWLERRFDRLRAEAAQAAQAAQGEASDWRATFAGELQAVLLAELDLRLQPLEALREAAREAAAARTPSTLNPGSP